MILYKNILDTGLSFPLRLRLETYKRFRERMTKKVAMAYAYCELIESTF